MRLLLDTHALLWWWMIDPFLPAGARALMADPANDVLVSAATGWEIATKVREGQLPAMRELLSDFEGHLSRDGFRVLTVTMAHGIRGGIMPGGHNDPFDRLIAAQALIEDLTVVTRDPEIAAFGCKVLW